MGKSKRDVVQESCLIGYPMLLKQINSNGKFYGFQSDVWMDLHEK